jgi:PadR family transcriptional regulator PadR
MAGLKITTGTAAVLQAFLDDPTQERYGYDLMKLTGFASGKLYPILAKLDAAGYLERHREPDPEPGRPVRYNYKITPDGIAFARHGIAELHRQLGSVRQTWTPRPAGGLA